LRRMISTNFAHRTAEFSAKRQSGIAEWTSEVSLSFREMLSSRE
jgi:hypothetical protein